MTRYRVPVADSLLAQRDTWKPVKGFRLISMDGPWLAHPDVTICTFEDDYASTDLEGKLVEPTLTLYEGEVLVTGRCVVS